MLFPCYQLEAAYDADKDRIQGVGTFPLNLIRLQRRNTRFPRFCSWSGQRMRQSCATVTMFVVAQVSARRPCAVVLRLNQVMGFRDVPVAVVAAYAGQGSLAVRSRY